MAKKRKLRDQNGETTMPRDQMPMKGSPNICDVLIQFKDTIQVKVNTDERLQKLEEKVEKIENISNEDLSCLLKEVRKKKLIDEIKEDLRKELINELKEDLKKELIDELKEDLKKKLIDEVKEDLRKELTDALMEDLKLEIQDKMQKLEEKVDNNSKKNFSVFKEDIKKELKVKEEPDLNIQEEMQKEGCAKVNTSLSLRTQSNQSLTTRFQLVIKSTVSSPAFKGKPIQTDDSEGHIEVVLLESNRPIAPNHHLASATVQLVVVKTELGEGTQGSWSKEEFIESIIEPRPGIPKLVKNGRFTLVGGRYRHKGVVIMDNSNRKDYKLGVMIVSGVTEERVLEGVSNSFRVQEAKTDPINRGKRKEDTAEELPRHTGQNFSYAPNKIESGTLQPSSPQATVQNSAQLATTQIQGNDEGQDGNRNIQQYVPQFATQTSTQVVQQAAHLPPIAHAHTTGNGQVGPIPLDCLQQQYNTKQGTTQFGNRENISNGTLGVNQLQQPNTTQQVTAQLENHGQGWQLSNPPTERNCLFGQNPSHITYALTTGNISNGTLGVNQLQQPNTTQQVTAQLENHGQGWQQSNPPTKRNFLFGQNLSHITYAPTTENISNGTLGVHQLQQPNTAQQVTAQLENHGQGWQQSNPPTKRNFLFGQNLLHITYAPTTENISNGTLGVNQLQQPNTTQQVTAQLGNHGQGRQHSNPVIFEQNPSHITYAQTTENISNGTLRVNQLQQPNTTQQFTAQLENHGQGQQYGLPPTGQVCNFSNILNPSQRADARTTGNGQLGPLPLDRLQQQYNSQQGTTQNHGNGPDGRLLVDQLQQQNTSQMGIVQLENPGSDLLLDLAVSTRSFSLHNNCHEASVSTAQIKPPEHQFSQDQHMGVSESPVQNLGLGGWSDSVEKQDV